MRIHALLARRGVRVSWRTVHRLLKRHGFMVRIVKKPQSFKRFQRRHVDSLWQVDAYKFRIAGSGDTSTSTPYSTTGPGSS